MLNTAIGVG